MEKIFLILGITAIASLLTLQLLDYWMLGLTGIIAIFLLSVLLIDPLDSKARNEKMQKLTNLESKLKLLSIPESTSAPLPS
jgi:hypothetical protein